MAIAGNGPKQDSPGADRASRWVLPGFASTAFLAVGTVGFLVFAGWDLDSRLLVAGASMALVSILLGWQARAAGRADRERRRAEQMRSDVVAMLSHDLKNPLTAIIRIAHVLRARPPADTGELCRLLDIVEASAREAVVLASNFVDTLRLDGGKLPLEPVPLSLNELVTQAVQRQEGVARVGGVTLETELADDLPEVRLDRRVMERVVTNLVSNALKSAPAKSRVRVTTARRGDQLSVAVEDEGPGIAPEDRDKLFRRSSLLGNPRADSTGLGLYIVKAMVEAHGGEVSVDSAASGGARFTVSFDAKVIAGS